MPVRCGTDYQKNIKVRWTDKDTGKERVKAFHWDAPAEREWAWLRGVGHKNVRIVREHYLSRDEKFAKRGRQRTWRKPVDKPEPAQ